MIRANIAELKNRLSHYLRLVKGGETIEIVDRHTPMAHIESIGKDPATRQAPAWVHELLALGIVKAPEGKKRRSRLLGSLPPVPTAGAETGALGALIAEREEGR